MSSLNPSSWIISLIMSFLLQVKAVLSTLSGQELVQLKGHLQLISAPFSLVDFDEEELDDRIGV